MKIRKIPDELLKNGKLIWYPFNTTDDLLNIDWIKHYTKQPNFARFSLSQNRLVVEYKDGNACVIGFIPSWHEINLPKWYLSKTTNHLTPPTESINNLLQEKI